MKKAVVLLFLFLCILTGCDIFLANTAPEIDRMTLIPVEQEKIHPSADVYPPVSETELYADPVPLPYPVNTAGAEDSAFILPDGNSLYLWFTPDVQKLPEEQVSDGVTGIYRSDRLDDAWSEPERVYLQKPGKLALDGCAFIQSDRMWFCSAREGNTGLHWFTALYRDGRWQDWRLADFQSDYEVGELHISADGMELYFHSSRPGGHGGYDIWVSKNEQGIWQPPENIEAVNSAAEDGWPFLTQDGQELWFTRGNGAPALYRSMMVDGECAAPQMMFSNFAGEASLDNAGNVYFTHHFFEDGVMLEADIYIARRK